MKDKIYKAKIINELNKVAGHEVSKIIADEFAYNINKIIEEQEQGEQPTIELSKLSKLDLKQMLLEIFEHRMGDFTIDHYVTLIFYSLTNTK